MNQFRKNIKTFLTFRWQPGQDTLVALVSLVLSAISWLWLVRIPLQPGVSLLPQILVNGFMLWEPFFVFGWLQQCFERAFGILPGILLAGIAMGTYHLGTFGLSGVLMMVVFGISFGAVFRVTRNLLSMWPLTWAICASIGTQSGGIFFHWSEGFIYAVILVIQLVGITVIVMLARKSVGWKEVQL